MERSHIAEIIHLSDLHFGPKNITKVIGPIQKKRSLAELLLRDIKQEPPLQPMVKNGEIRMEKLQYEKIICLTGDFASAGLSEELNDAQEFLKELYTGLGWDIGTARERIILIPGNHDLEWSKQNAALRWQTWRVFYDDFYGVKSDANNPLAWVRLCKIKQANAAVLCLDSEHHIYEKSEYKHCGAILEEQIEHVEDLLKKAAADEWFQGAIKIALVHHHPILIPSLVELGRGPGQKDNDPGYDAIFDAQHLLNLMHRYGFHLLLHGHKHIPHVFTEDIVNACHQTSDHSMVVVAGGTLGSNDSVEGWRQSYNQIHFHWHPTRQTTRIEVNTRGLVRYDPDTKQELSWKNWHWNTMRLVDRFSNSLLTVPTPNLNKLHSEPPYAAENSKERKRADEYKRLRGNMPVADTRPSLIPGQSYEVRFWLAAHKSDKFQQTEKDRPTKVIWSAGPKFPKKTIERKDDEKFCGVFHCYGPMLIQAEIHFSDGKKEMAYVYSRFPEETKR